ncbi:hypothetical protein DSO57_1004323 [Entomophthora muscae]|uniref:Uncharacterized protein n=1 Tax=Entomophthora muscae TaxID=34485 RepID=A0ACC2SKW1_9FUNG|nr:hypothetical protein DSO57_1004323 [Entomophthora muscae]
MGSQDQPLSGAAPAATNNHAPNLGICNGPKAALLACTPVQVALKPPRDTWLGNSTNVRSGVQTQKTQQNGGHLNKI